MPVQIVCQVVGALDEIHMVINSQIMESEFIFFIFFSFPLGNPDYVIDCIDNLDTKVLHLSTLTYTLNPTIIFLSFSSLFPVSFFSFTILINATKSYNEFRQVELIQYCTEHNIRVISSMGAGAKADVSSIRYGSIEEAEGTKSTPVSFFFFLFFFNTFLRLVLILFLSLSRRRTCCVCKEGVEEKGCIGP